MILGKEMDLVIRTDPIARLWQIAMAIVAVAGALIVAGLLIVAYLRRKR